MLKKFLAIAAMLFASAIAMAAVDVNKATEAELDSVKGIGPGTSKMILDERRKGEFKSWEDFVSRVKGVGDKRAENLSDAGLTVGGKAYKPATATAAPSRKEDAKAEKKAEAKADSKAAKAEKAEAKAEKKEAKAEAKKDDKPTAAAKPAATASAAKK